VISKQGVIMKTISAVDARKGLGHLLNLVSIKHETIVIERAGEKLAVLKPYDTSKEVEPDTARGGRLSLLDLAGVGGEIWAGVDVDQYLQREREQWP
jgi:hypothetical protein